MDNKEFCSRIMETILSDYYDLYSVLALLAQYKEDGMGQDDMANSLLKVAHDVNEIDEIYLNRVLELLDYVSGFCDSMNSIY